MSEFEIHQLMTGSRYEFDLGTAACIFLTVAVAAIVLRDGPKWSRATAFWIGGFYLSCSAFLAIRTFASLVRFAKQDKLLMALDPQFVVGNMAVQMPTGVLRGLVFILAPLLILLLLRQRVRR